MVAAMMGSWVLCSDRGGDLCLWNIGLEGGSFCWPSNDRNLAWWSLLFVSLYWAQIKWKKFVPTRKKDSSPITRLGSFCVLCFLLICGWNWRIGAFYVSLCLYVCTSKRTSPLSVRVCNVSISPGNINKLDGKVFLRKFHSDWFIETNMHLAKLNISNTSRM